MAQASFASNPPQHAQASLPLLPAHLQSDTQLTSHLASRFHQHLPTSQLSSRAVIAINTHSSSHVGPDGGEEGSSMGAAKELASRAWARLGHRSENQAVTFL
jgi:chitin synthase